MPKGGPVIVRLWRGQAPADSAAAYERHVTAHVFPKLEQIDGYVGGRVLRRDVDGAVEFVVMTEWASLNAIRSFAGDTLDRAVIDPEARELLSAYDEYVELFEVTSSDSRGSS